MQRVDLKGVSDTMLQTLYARAAESRKPDARIHDEQAIHIVEQLENDFSAARGDAPMSVGVVARTMLLDRMVGAYVESHPDATVLNLACGLDTRFYRVDNQRIRWVNLDLPAVIEVRRRLLPESGRVSAIGASVTDPAWPETVAPLEGDVLVVVEGLTMYLHEDEVRTMLGIIARNFCRVTCFVEVMSPFVVRHVRERSIAQSGSRFVWGTRSGQGLCELCAAFRHVEDRSLVETMAELYPVYKVLGKIAPVRRLSNTICVIER